MRKAFALSAPAFSGGEEGVRYGPSIMPGGNEEAWPFVKPVLHVLPPPKPTKAKRKDWVGKDGQAIS